MNGYHFFWLGDHDRDFSLLIAHSLQMVWFMHRHWLLEVTYLTKTELSFTA